MKFFHLKWNFSKWKVLSFHFFFEFALREWYALLYEKQAKKNGDFCIRRLGMSRVQYVLRMLVKWFFVNANNSGRFTTQCVKRRVDSNTMPMAPLSAMVVIFFRIACSKIPVGTFRMYLKTNRLQTLRWPLTWTIPWMRVRLLVNSMRSSSLTVESTTKHVRNDSNKQKMEFR